MILSKSTSISNEHYDYFLGPQSKNPSDHTFLGMGRMSLQTICPGPLLCHSAEPLVLLSRQIPHPTPLVDKARQEGAFLQQPSTD